MGAQKYPTCLYALQRDLQKVGSPNILSANKITTDVWKGIKHVRECLQEPTNSSQHTHLHMLQTLMLFVHLERNDFKYLVSLQHICPSFYQVFQHNNIQAF